ncbi:MAG: RNA polymerase sigma factor [Frankia sp.]
MDGDAGPAAGRAAPATDVAAQAVDQAPRSSGFRLSNADRMLVAGLRARDETAYRTLIGRYGSSMLRVASAHVPTRSAAEDVVQETWLVALTAADRFEGRSSLSTWLFGILINLARARGRGERRMVPFSSAYPEEDGPTVPPERFHPRDGDQPWPGAWMTTPHRFELPEPAVLSREVRLVVRAALDDLPPRQRAIVNLRDVEGLDAQEVCGLLDISPGNQRVLLHRGRARLREVLETYLAADRA